MHCGKTLMLFRKFKSKTQRNLAEKLMTTQQYVSELERQEHINVEKINRILNVLNSNREEWDKFRRLLPLSK